MRSHVLTPDAFIEELWPRMKGLKVKLAAQKGEAATIPLCLPQPILDSIEQLATTNGVTRGAVLAAMLTRTIDD